MCKRLEIGIGEYRKDRDTSHGSGSDRALQVLLCSGVHFTKLSHRSPQVETRILPRMLIHLWYPRQSSISVSWPVWELLLEMCCDFSPCRHPHTILLLNVFHKVPQCFCSTGLSNDTTAAVSNVRAKDLFRGLAYLCIGTFIIFPPSRYSMSKVAFKYFSYMSLPTKPGLMWNLPSRRGSSLVSRSVCKSRVPGSTHH